VTDVSKDNYKGLVFMVRYFFLPTTPRLRRTRRKKLTTTVSAIAFLATAERVKTRFRQVNFNIEFGLYNYNPVNENPGVPVYPVLEHTPL
jgi:hypothetical protein